MHSSKEELLSWRRISHLLDQLNSPKSRDGLVRRKAVPSCPFCGTPAILNEPTEDTHERDGEPATGSFTCSSCGHNWLGGTDR